jgi:hypothetical protein
VPVHFNWHGCPPIGFNAIDPNLYRYVSNAPTNETDPSGLKPIPAPLRPVPPDPAVAWIGNWTNRLKEGINPTPAVLKKMADALYGRSQNNPRALAFVRSVFSGATNRVQLEANCEQLVRMQLINRPNTTEYQPLYRQIIRALPLLGDPDYRTRAAATAMIKEVVERAFAGITKDGGGPFVYGLNEAVSEALIPRAIPESFSRAGALGALVSPDLPSFQAAIQRR